MGRVANPFKGVNSVCAQCLHDCKQFENVVLINCPKFQSSQAETPLPCSYGKSHRIRNKGGKSGM
jgi:hypothetical protein